MSSVDAFAAFVEAVHGHPPFAWQRRLADQVLTGGGWPEVIDIPTGFGKTMTLDLALFALAHRVSGAPRRTAFVVDRRVIVQQVAQRAQRVAAALSGHQSLDGAVGGVREGLLSLQSTSERREPSPSTRPFVLAELRGGIRMADDWVMRPDVPAVLVTTVDQIGSRLLFNGYGVTDRMAPVHSGLVGNDCLYLLDEVHLSTAFRDTLRAVVEQGHGAALPRRLTVCELSATPDDRPAGRDVFALDPSSNDLADPLLVQRRGAPRRAALRGPLGASRAEPGELVAQEAAKLVLEREAATSAVVVNRVATAVRCAELLRGDRADSPRADVHLLTGRMRPVDRDRVLDGALMARVGAVPGRRQERQQRPVVVVATQSIEVGADLDVDFMITECASLDALRQRAGRVDRLGELHGSGDSAEIVVVAAKAALVDDDPVYGPALVGTWELLQQQASVSGTVELGPAAAWVDDLTAEERQRTQAPIAPAPLLTSAHLGLLAQTSPRPYGRPDVESFLHGLRERRAEVQVVWRADVTEEMLRSAETSGSVAEAVANLMPCPPTSAAALSLPLHAARSWLRGAEPVPVADAPMTHDDEPGGRDERPALRWRAEDSTVVSPGDIRPGDTLVVPSTYGGLEAANWSPSSTNPIDDLVEELMAARGRRRVLRLHPAVLPSPLATGVQDAAKQEPPQPDGSDDADPVPTQLAAWLHGLFDGDEQDDPDAAVELTSLSTAWREAISEMFPLRGGVRRPVPGMRVDEGSMDGQSYWVVSSPQTRTSHDSLAGIEDVLADADGSDERHSLTGAAVALVDHNDGVGRAARDFAERLGLPQQIADDLEMAGRLHDLGKVDDRFQLWLHNGDRVAAAMADRPLAKSTTELGHAARRRARALSGYPPGMRHELASLALLDASDGLLVDAHDPDLVRHLVASHHGRARPLSPVVSEGRPVTLTVEALGRSASVSSAVRYEKVGDGLAERFDRLNDRYGVHGLAWMEAILRLADHRRSQAEVELVGRDVRTRVEAIT